MLRRLDELNALGTSNLITRPAALSADSQMEIGDPMLAMDAVLASLVVRCTWGIV